MTPDTRALERAPRVFEALAAAGVPAGLFGGVAVNLSSPSARAPSPLSRGYSDVDVVVAGGNTGKVNEALTTVGAEADRRFNAHHGSERMLFRFEDEMHLDVFVDTVRMCHELALRDRLDSSRPWVTPADLLLSKLQVAELNRRDVLDVCALLLDHPLDRGAEGIEVERVLGVLGSDWGWWRTSTENLRLLDRLLPDVPLDAAQNAAVASALHALTAAVEEAPKTRRWKMRSRIGDRVPWRNEVEDVLG